MTPKAPSTAEHQPVLVVDTNALHYARLYLKFASKHGLAPLGKSAADAEKRLKENYEGRSLDNFKTGLNTVEYLRGQCDSNVLIEYSPVSHLELTCNLLRGRALENLAKLGLPRMWGHVRDSEIFSRLSSKDYKWIRKETNELEVAFGNAGILLEQIDLGRMPAVWQLADRVVKRVFLGWQDSLIYAGALLEEADELVTCDAHLKRVVNFIKNPGTVPDAKLREQIKELRTEIVQFVAADAGTQSSEIRLPRGHRP